MVSLDEFLLVRTTSVGRFLRAPRSVTAAFHIKVLVSGYQSIDLHCIVLPVKFEWFVHLGSEK
jgi:hypothetical protein